MALCQNVSFLFGSKTWFKRKNLFSSLKVTWKDKFFWPFLFSKKSKKMKISKKVSHSYFGYFLLFGWKSCSLFSQQTNKSDRKRLITCSDGQLNWEQMISAFCIFTAWHNGQMRSFRIRLTCLFFNWQQRNVSIKKVLNKTK